MQELRHLVLFIPLGLAACQSTERHSFAPLSEARPQEVHLTIEPRLANAAFVSEVKAKSHRAPGLRTESDFVERPELVLEVGFYAVDPDWLEGVLGSGTLFAHVYPRAEAARLRDELQVLVERGDARSLEHVTQIVEGDHALTYARVEQVAYIEGFDLTSTADHAIADPRVGIAHDGMWWIVESQAAGEGRVMLDVDMTLSELERPIAERELPLTANAPVTVQLPSAITRHLTSRVEMGEDEVLVLGGRALPVEGGVGRALLALAAPDVP